MNRIVLILVIILAFPHLIYAQRKRAFMVGISKYHTNGYKVWNNIHGAEDVALLKPELEKKGFKVLTLSNEQATYQGILNALNSFIATSKKGDVVYLHFSCHGQPVEDGLNGRAKDEKDGWDESVVPIDAGKVYCSSYKGEKHMTDDELNGYIGNLRKKIGPTGMLFVVMDACHAGNMEREGFETIRGTNEGFTKRPKNKYNPAPVRKRSRIEKSAYLAPVLFVEACESFERNQEVFFEEKAYGALSLNVWQTLRGSELFPSSFRHFKSRLSLNVKRNKEKRNRLWPGTQTLVFDE